MYSRRGSRASAAGAGCDADVGFCHRLEFPPRPTSADHHAGPTPLRSGCIRGLFYRETAEISPDRRWTDSGARAANAQREKCPHQCVAAITGPVPERTGNLRESGRSHTFSGRCGREPGRPPFLDQLGTAEMEPPAGLRLLDVPRDRSFRSHIDFDFWHLVQAKPAARFGNLAPKNVPRG